ncbi:MAG: hypothetical protein ACJ71K_19010 [Nitrososphaeraceae archaeon]
MNYKKGRYNGMQKTIDDDTPYEIIELNESAPIVFERDKKEQQHICETVNSENNKHLILVIPKQENIATIYCK